MNTQLYVWREACRHIDITEFVARITDWLGRRVPVDLVLVRGIDAVSERLETAAVGRRGERPVPERLRTDLGADGVRTVRTWCRWGAVYHEHTASHDKLLSLLAPEGVHGDVLAGPLVDASGTAGVLVLVADPPRRFTESHRALVATLLEPFTVALANDRRLHELARLREAAEAENRALKSRLARRGLAEEIIGADGGFRTVVERLEQVAPMDAPVLLIGETGSGKEVVARAIHARSRRAAGPMVRVNCGAIPPGLVDSELFGHERGSFTGAVAARQGWFERADGGTLFLDEIGDLPLEAQVRLLRILQDGTFERVGGQRTLHVDVRIVAATNRDLVGMIASGGFRQDLWYRVGVFPIRLPALRERMEDLPDLATHFARVSGLRVAGAPLLLSSEDLELLRSYDWPGNVRELTAVIERAAILGDGKRLALHAALGVPVPPGPRERTAGRLSIPTAPVTPSAGRAAGVSLDDAMAHHIREALERSRGRIEGPFGAAALLGVNPHTLRGRMRRLGIDWSHFRRAARGGSTASMR